MSSEPTLRTLPVDLEEIDSCASSADAWWSEGGVIGYVDTETGAVHSVSVAALRAAEEGEAPGELSEWEKDDYDLAVTILTDRYERYQRIEPWESQEEYRLMEEFAQASRNPAVRAQLLQTISGKGAFSRFKDVLFRWPEVRQAWFAFHDQAHRQWIRQWLNSLGVDPLDTSNHAPPPLPESW